jgi:hypothetical protein
MGAARAPAVPPGRGAPRAPRAGHAGDGFGDVSRQRLEAEERILMRALPGTPYVRASVGAWSSEESSTGW